MIHNVVFDLFGALTRFDTEGYYRSHCVESGDRALLQREVFRSLAWAMLDRGAISEADAAAAVCNRLPARLHRAATDFIYRKNRALLPISGMCALLDVLKAAGSHLFLLSNTSVAFHRFRDCIPGISRFEGAVISADMGLVKPDPEIFRLACRRFGIAPSESLFIDDSPINAEAAQYVGMRAFVFNDDIQALRNWLVEEGLPISTEATPAAPGEERP